MRAPICGGAPATPVATDASTGKYALLVDEAYLYWTASPSGDLYRAPKDGGAPELLTSSAGGGLGQTSTHLYWFDTWYDNGWNAAIRRAPKTGGPVETVLDAMPDPYPSGQILSDDTYLYWLSGTGSCSVNRLPLSGGDAEYMGFGEGIPRGMVADATDLWVLSDFSNSVWVQRFPKAGGDGVHVATLPGSAQQIAVDDASVFVSVEAFLPNPNSKEGILQFPKAGGAYSWAVEGEIAPYGLAVDDLYLYYTHNELDGAVRQIPKP
jgi:hypothetical protein